MWSIVLALGLAFSTSLFSADSVSFSQPAKTKKIQSNKPSNKKLLAQYRKLIALQLAQINSQQKEISQLHTMLAQSQKTKKDKQEIPNPFYRKTHLPGGGTRYDY